jgi:hypothetical protein
VKKLPPCSDCFTTEWVHDKRCRFYDPQDERLCALMEQDDKEEEREKHLSDVEFVNQNGRGK